MVDGVLMSAEKLKSALQLDLISLMKYWDQIEKTFKGKYKVDTQTAFDKKVDAQITAIENFNTSFLEFITLITLIEKYPKISFELERIHWVEAYAGHIYQLCHDEYLPLLRGKKIDLTNPIAAKEEKLWETRFWSKIEAAISLLAKESLRIKKDLEMKETSFDKKEVKEFFKSISVRRMFRMVPIARWIPLRFNMNVSMRAIAGMLVLAIAVGCSKTPPSGFENKTFDPTEVTSLQRKNLFRNTKEIFKEKRKRGLIFKKFEFFGSRLLNEKGKVTLPYSERRKIMREFRVWLKNEKGSYDKFGLRNFRVEMKNGKERIIIIVPIADKNNGKEKAPLSRGQRERENINPTMGLDLDQMRTINRKRKVFQRVERQTGVPWEVLGAIWYREASLKTRVRRPGGPFQFDRVPKRLLRSSLARYTRFNTAQRGRIMRIGTNSGNFENTVILAAIWLQYKAEHQGTHNRLTPGSSDEEIMQAFFSYNGRASRYRNDPRNSPYVFNGADRAHTGMRLRGSILRHGGGRRRVNIVDRRPGAFVVYRQILRN